MRKEGAVGKFSKQAGMWAGALLGATLGVNSLTLAQAPPDEAAVALMNSARLAYNDRNYPVAADRFRSYIQQFPNRRNDLLAAQYGLGLTLMQADPRDFNAAAAALQPVAGMADFADRAFALYYLGLAYRGQGNTSPDKTVATQRFTQAATTFAAAAQAFAARIKTPPPADAKELPVDMEWMARARCDQAEMLLWIGSAQPALAVVEPLLKDPVLGKSKYRRQAAYQQGYASFQLKDYVGAGRALATLAPFDDSELGVHARYLLARTHHLAGERPEAANLYAAVVAGYQNQRAAAEAALKNPEALKDKPEEKARFQAIVSAPAPEYVTRAGFYSGILLYEQGKFADALGRFQTFSQQNPKSPLVADAQLRQGFCQVQLRQFNEAVSSFQGLLEHPALGDQALRWSARAQIAAADPANPAAFDQAVKGGIEKLNRSVEKLRAMNDPNARIRRGDVTLELADAQEKARQYAEAAATYQKVASGNYGPEATEEAMQGLATALQLAGKYAESDQACQQFQQTYPKSTMTPVVMFRFAENAYLRAMATAASPSAGVGADQIKPLYAEAIARYQKVIDKYPGFPHISLARQGMAAAQYHIGQYAEAAATLAKIPDSDCSGPLDPVPYLRADCLLRVLPKDSPADDALATARYLGQLEVIVDLLSGYTAAHEIGPLTPDAAIKLGYCQQGMAELLADPQERQQILIKARGNYARYAISKMQPNDPLFPVAVLEDAKVLQLIGGFPAAVRELQRFQNAPLKNSPLATLAMLRLAEGHRMARKPQEAVTVLGQWRQANEAALLADKKKAAWVPALQFGHAMALKEVGQFAEARALFENIAKTFPKEPEAAEVPLRLAQCRREEGVAQLNAARKALAAGGAADQIQAAQGQIAAAVAGLRETGEQFRSNAETLKDKPERLETRLRMLYEAAWCYRDIAEVEVAAARQAAQAAAAKRLQEKIARENPAVKPAGLLQVAEIQLSEIPLQPSEQKARELYGAVVTVGVDAPLTLDARFELAEMLAQREELDPAIALLAGGLQQDPPQDIADKMRLRLGACYLAKKNGKAAFAQFEAIAGNPKSALLAYAKYGAGEAAFQQGDWQGAIQRLLPFQDHELLRHLLGTTDRALLRLGQAYAQAGQWDPSRRALEALTQRFPRSAWGHEARYGIGLAFQTQKQWDNAITAYNEVAGRTGQEIAAKALIQIGLCKLEQKKTQEALTALLAVPYTYDYPECSAMALCEASRAHVELKQTEDAKKVLSKVMAEYPKSQWAEVARKRLAEIK